MGRRRRRVIRIVKKKLPTVFICPRCGEEAVRVTIAKDTGHATVLCALCNLKDEFPAHPAAQPIDVYSYFTDRFYGVKEPRAIIPREREIMQPPSDEAMGEEEPTAPKAVAGEQMEEAPPVAGLIGPEKEDRTLKPEDLDRENPEPTVEKDTSQETVLAIEESASDAPTMPTAEEEKESEEEKEPFADILENKDKKRYSSQPIPQQSTEQTN